MQTVTTINATYCTNFNGLFLKTTIDGEVVDLQDVLPKEMINDCIDAIVDELFSEYDEDGVYCGINQYVEQVITKHIHDAFGAVVKVVVVFDGISS